MTMTRREFAGTSLAAAGATALPALGATACTGETGPSPDSEGAAAERAARPGRLLILGGTGFIGPHMVRHALERGHEITLFNRGRTNPGLFPGVETLIGDRDGALDALRGKEWDYVIDNSGYVPRLVRDSANLLRDAVGRYLFTSTGSVYDFDQDELPEDAGLLEVTDPESEDVGRYYGPLKVMCEEAVREIFGDRGTIARLHVVAGPGDPTDRFTYWPVRIHRGGEVIAPGDMDNPVQFIDVRDLAEFNMHLLEQDTGGIFNVAGPTLDETRMDEFLYGIRAVTTSRVSFAWVDEDFLANREPPARYPLWYSQNGPARALARVRSHRGVEAGLRFRPLAVTARETVDWFLSEPEERRQQLQLNLDRDARILEAWRRRGGAGS
ncbi:NAD-dependent epimerase/dehydratase family protein [Candidatus Palauibacter sp.]|uniref:NAD-dependent epimerase/dehydratase family protein n=1 Tax=Candidatus Palauibacter sp. TaxID=3101350 RepID=UPI003B021630